MAQVSERFAKKVSGYETTGTLVRSAEGRSIARSKKSMEQGKALSRRNLQRVMNLQLDN